MDGTVLTCPSGFSSDDKLSAAMQECRVNKKLPRVFAAMGERRANKISTKWGWVHGYETLPFLQRTGDEFTAASVPTKQTVLIARHGETTKSARPRATYDKHRAAHPPPARKKSQRRPTIRRFKSERSRKRDPAAKAQRGTRRQEGEGTAPVSTSKGDARGESEWKDEVFAWI